MPARLVPLSDQPPAPVIDLQRPVLLIGRHPDCDIRIDLPQISRRHCCLATAYDRLIVRDLGSRNGVRVNGRMIEEVQVLPGDEIAIAQVIYRLEADETPSATAAKAKPSSLDDPDGDLIPLDD